MVREGRRERRKEESVRKMVKGRERESVRPKRKSKKKKVLTHEIGKIKKLRN